jgi:hypothetical protein
LRSAVHDSLRRGTASYGGLKQDQRRIQEKNGIALKTKAVSIGGLPRSEKKTRVFLIMGADIVIKKTGFSFLRYMV